MSNQSPHRVAQRSRNQPGATSPRPITQAARKLAAAAIGVALAVGVLLVVPRPVIEPDDSPAEAQDTSESPLSVPEIPVSASANVVDQAGLIEPAGIARPLKLFAVLPERDPTVGRAVLGAAEASSRTYVVGALLENGAQLVEVFDDRAVLVRESRTYTLYLPNRGIGDTLDAPDDLTVGDFAPPQPELQASGARVTDVLRMAPAYEGDSIVGFAAYPGSRRDQFDAWGLRSGDVLVSAGGYPLNDVAQMEAVSERLTTGAVLVADVLRGSGERRKVTLDGSVLLAAATPPTPAPFPIQ